MDKIRVGVVGVGALGQHHARVYARLPGADLVGVADTRPGRADEIARSCGTAAYTDFRELIGRMDAASIATPSSLHASIGSELLAAGVHILVEKPVAHSLAEADRLIESARAAGKLLQVGHVERFNPGVRVLREIVHRPRFFEAHRMGLFSPRSLDIDVILDLMIHDLDIISLLVPSAPVRIHAMGLPILSRRIDIANARIEFEDGCVANITASRVSTEKIRKLRLFQPLQYVSLDYTRQDVTLFELRGALGLDGNQLLSRKIEPPKKQPLEEELRAFLDAIRDGSPVACSGEDGRRSLALALDILEQANRALAREFDRQ